MVGNRQVGEIDVTSGRIRPLAQRSAPGLIAEMIRNAVAAGEFEPGEQLREERLAEQLGVSRGPVREAFQRLIQEGLLRSELNRGVFVKELDAARIADIYLVRTALERCAGEVIIANSDGEATTRLQVLVDEMASAEQVGDQQELIRLDLEFHQALVAASGSDRLEQLFSTLIYEVGMCLAALGSTANRREVHVAGEHLAILEAVKDGDVVRLGKAVSDHSNSATETLQTALEGTVQPLAAENDVG